MPSLMLIVDNVRAAYDRLRGRWVEPWMPGFGILRATGARDVWGRVVGRPKARARRRSFAMASVACGNKAPVRACSQARGYLRRDRDGNLAMRDWATRGDHDRRRRDEIEGCPRALALLLVRCSARLGGSTGGASLRQGHRLLCRARRRRPTGHDHGLTLPAVGSTDADNQCPM